MPSNFGLPGSRTIEGGENSILPLFKETLQKFHVMTQHFCSHFTAKNILLRWNWFQSRDRKNSIFFLIWLNGCSEIKLRFSNGGEVRERMLGERTNSPLPCSYVYCHSNKSDFYFYMSVRKLSFHKKSSTFPCCSYWSSGLSSMAHLVSISLYCFQLPQTSLKT